jgi:hypothetical protein
MVGEVRAIQVEEGSGSSLWQESGGFCCSDVVVVVVFGKEVLDVFDGVAVVLCEDGWNVFEEDNWGVVDGGGLE